MFNFSWRFLIGLFLLNCRKDTYGVFSDPVDPEEVCVWLWIAPYECICFIFVFLIHSGD